MDLPEFQVSLAHIMRARQTNKQTTKEILSSEKNLPTFDLITSFRHFVLKNI